MIEQFISILLFKWLTTNYSQVYTNEFGSFEELLSEGRSDFLQLHKLLLRCAGEGCLDTY